MHEKLSPTGVTAIVGSTRFTSVEDFARAVGLKPQQLLPGGWKMAWLTEAMIRRAARQSRRKAISQGRGLWLVE